jgi:IS30 family transposase
MSTEAASRSGQQDGRHENGALKLLDRGVCRCRLNTDIPLALVDRRSRYLRLIHLPDGHRADQLVTALEAALVSMSAGKRLTLTWDQGREMARHDEVAQLFSQGVFLANPGSAWMRGTNENTNGLLRQVPPKGN